MRKANSKSAGLRIQDMRSEYDFAHMTGGVRGKYYKAYRAGHTVRIHKLDGSIVVQHFKLEDGAVMLAPDVQEHFPDSEAVNNALRCLIPLIRKKQGVKRKKRLSAKHGQML